MATKNKNTNVLGNAFTRKIKDTKVEVNIKTTAGINLLNEIHPKINEGDIIQGKLIGDGLLFKWHGLDAMLWVGENCKIYKGKKKHINK